MAENTLTINPLRRALSNRNYRLLWIGGSTSMLGSQFSLIALPWLVLKLTNDPGMMGLVLALGGLPRAAFMLVGGAFTDRISARYILVACDAINFVLSGIMAILVLTNTIQIWMILVLALLTGLLSGFVMPASSSIIPRILPEDDWQAGNALSFGTMQFMNLVGPALAGILISLYGQTIPGLAPAFFIDATSFGLCAIILSMLRGVDQVAEPAAGTESVWASITHAARYAAEQSSLRAAFLILMVTNFLMTGPLIVGTPVLADQKLPEGATAFGLLASGFALGSLLGHILTGSLPRPKSHVFRLMFITLIASFGIVMIVLGWIPSTALDAILMVAMGTGNGYLTITIFTWIQQSAPKEMLGRVMSMTMLVVMGLTPISQIIAGIISKWSLTGLFTISGGLLLLAAVWLVISPELTQLTAQVVAPQK
jgi:MFS family permease